MQDTTLKELKKEEQSSVDEYNSRNSQTGLNCVRSYRNPELTYDYRKESIRLIKANPTSRVLRQYTSKNKSELCYDNEIPIQLIQYNKTSNHSLKTQQINLIINNLGSAWKSFFLVFMIFWKKRKTTHIMGMKLLQISVLTSIYNL